LDSNWIYEMQNNLVHKCYHCYEQHKSETKMTLKSQHKDKVIAQCCYLTYLCKHFYHIDNITDQAFYDDCLDHNRLGTCTAFVKKKPPVPFKIKLLRWWKRKFGNVH